MVLALSLVPIVTGKILFFDDFLRMRLSKLARRANLERTVHASFFAFQPYQAGFLL